MITFTWDDPYTLNGVPILGYQVLAVFNSSKNSDIILTSTQVVQKGEFITVNPFRSGFCVFVNLTTSAINMAGLGKPKTITSHFIESKY